MKRLNKIENVVENILIKQANTRASDDLLYLYVCEYFNQGATSMTLSDFLKTRNSIDCPTFTSVARARRKVFEKRPELNPKAIAEKREEARIEYVEYALSH